MWEKVWMWTAGIVLSVAAVCLVAVLIMAGVLEDEGWDEESGE